MDVLPYGASAHDVEAIEPDGVVVCNGPGDPEQADRAIDTVRDLIGKLTADGRLPGPSDSRPGNRRHHQPSALRPPRRQPAHQGLWTRAAPTSPRKNHGFQVDAASIPASSGFRVSHVNLNDGSVEGLAHDSLPVFSVQYHPEASPGPQDNQYLFDRFLDLVDDNRRS